MPIRESPLFSPIALGKLTLSGRLIKTATAETRADAGGFVTRELIVSTCPWLRAGRP